MRESTASSHSDRRPIRSGLLSEPLTDLATVRLIGCECHRCGETTLGLSEYCPQCGGEELSAVDLATTGELLTYSVVRHRPPGNYKGPEPFQPFGIGLVGLAQGLSVVTPLRGDPAAFDVGQQMRFEAHPLYRDEDGKEVIAFRFAKSDDGI